MTVLRLEHLSRRFGGNEVLRDVNFALDAGERVALIGPNGAGKSTLFNIVSGQLPVSGGRIHFNDNDVTERSPRQRVRLGIGRSFQLTSLLTGLTVFDNVMLALHGTRASRYQPFRALLDYRQLVDHAAELLGPVDLWDRRNEAAANLSYGQQKKLEIAMALALEPQLLLLDEPAAGLSPGEVQAFMAMLRGLVGHRTLLFTEHDMNVVFGLADRIIVLYYGRIIASGSPDEIRANREVREIYLGVQKKADDGG